MIVLFLQNVSNEFFLSSFLSHCLFAVWLCHCCLLYVCCRNVVPPPPLSSQMLSRLSFIYCFSLMIAGIVRDTVRGTLRFCTFCVNSFNLIPNYPSQPKLIDTHECF